VIDPQIRVGIDVGCKAHRVGIANPAGKILEEFDISHTDAGFQDFFGRIEQVLQLTDLPIEPLVYTPAEFEEMVKNENPFLLHVLQEGRKL